MENEFECLVVRGGDGVHFDEKFRKNIFPSQSYHRYRVAIRLLLLGNGQLFLKARLSQNGVFLS